MEMMDSFGKLDLALDAACKRNEKIYYDLAKELKKQPNLTIEMVSNEKGDRKQISIADYIKNFQWDNGRFQMNKSMSVIATKISAAQKTCDDRLKKIVDQQNAVKNKLQSYQKKQENASFMGKDLADVVYEQPAISGSNFVNTHGSELMTTILFGVPKAKVQVFKENYFTALISQKEKDYESWKKRTYQGIIASDEIKNFRDKTRNDMLGNDGNKAEDDVP